MATNDKKQTPEEPREGFNEQGERRVVTLDGLTKEFGAAEGERLYREICRAGEFGDWLNHSTTHRPPLPVAQLKGEQRAEVERILKGAKKKEA